MYFSELLTKITLGTQNQKPTKAQIKKGNDIMKRAERHKEISNKREEDIVCRVINGSKVKKRKYHKEEDSKEEKRITYDITMSSGIKINNRIRINFKDMRKFLNHIGYVESRHSNSTHIVFKNDKGVSVPVPNKKGTLCQGTVSKILKQTGSSREELAQFLYEK